MIYVLVLRALNDNFLFAAVVHSPANSTKHYLQKARL